MAMIRPKGKALKIAQQVMKPKGVKVEGGYKSQKPKVSGPYLQH